MTYLLPIEVETPKVPNYLMLKGNDKVAEKISIGKFSDEQLQLLGERWITDLLKRAAEIRKNPLDVPQNR